MITLATLAFAGDVEIRHRYDALYLEQTGRHEAAAAWYLADLDQHLPDYLRVIGQVPAQRSPALVAQVTQWREAHPDDPKGAVALAIAYSYAGLSRYTWTSPFHEAGPWCEPALAALAALPADPFDRYQVLRARVQAGPTCGQAVDEDYAAIKALALSGELGAKYRAWFGDEDGVDADDLSALQAALAEQPSLLGDFEGYFDEGATGPALDEARALLLDRARAWPTADHPADLAGAVKILEAAKATDEVRPARERLKSLDPGHRANLRALEPEPRTAEDDALDPTTLVDPAQRLAALQATSPPAEAWERILYWSAMADAAEALGDEQAQLKALGRLWVISPGIDPNLRYARATVAAGRDLPRGARAAHHAVAYLRDPWSYELPDADHPPADWRESLAEALDVRALVAAARGRHAQATDDLEEALFLAGPTPDRLLRLGELYQAQGDADRGAPLLARALAELPATDPRVPAATERLAAWLAAQPGWQPDAATWIAAARPPAAQPAPELDGSRFEDLVVEVAGSEQRLLDLKGPIVVDVWATWCGPCTASLPHLDALARRYEGRVHLVAVSVDREREAAERYLARRGEPAFTAAFLGAEGMSRLGLSGIPAVFVFDAEHRLVARLSGWSPGSTELDAAIEQMLASAGTP